MDGMSTELGVTIAAAACSVVAGGEVIAVAPW